MTVNRVRVTALACSFVVATTLAACGGESEDGPTTQSVDEYAKTQAAQKSKSSGSTPSASSGESKGEPTSSGKTSGSASETSGGSESGEASSSTSRRTATDDLPGVITDKKVTGPATKFVQNYITVLNRTMRDPSKVKELDKFTDPGCKTCASIRTDPVKLEKSNRRLTKDFLSIDVTKITTADESGQIRVFATVDQRRVPMVDESGKVTSHTKDGRPTENAFFVSADVDGRKILAIKTVVG